MSVRSAWGDRAWTDPGEPVPGPDGALVVTSFLARDGRVADPRWHEERFVRSCAEQRLEASTERLAGFLRAAWAALPPTGDWFPRIEAHPGPSTALVCWVRPAPALTSEVRLWLPPEPDPRTRPRVKGPDLAVLAALRERAREHGADDAVLVRRADDTVLETATAALLWWRGDTLCHPDPGLPVLPSVTARRVLARARAEGTAVVAERCEPDRLRGAEVWAVNALHGIRPVTGWLGSGPSGAELRSGRCRPADTARLARYRADHPTAHPSLPAVPR